MEQSHFTFAKDPFCFGHFTSNPRDFSECISHIFSVMAICIYNATPRIVFGYGSQLKFLFCLHVLVRSNLQTNLGQGNSEFPSEYTNSQEKTVY